MRRDCAALLQSTTVVGWFASSHVDLEGLLSDHLHCERKAAENALSLVRRYPGDAVTTERLARLAHEETSHLTQVAALLERRRLRLRPDTPNYYARGLLAEVRGNEPDRRIDAFLCAALIEARSHERLGLLSVGFAERADPELADFFAALAGAEERHAELFIELAERGSSPHAVAQRLDELAAREAEIVARLPAAARVH